MEPMPPNEPSPPQTGAPPLLPAEAASPVKAGRVIASWRWWIHFLILAIYPISLSLLSLSFKTKEEGPALKANIAHLGLLMLDGAIVFGLFFLVAWIASRATKDQLLLRSPSVTRSIAFGFVWSIALRVLVMIFVVILVIIAAAAGGASESDLKSLRPRVEILVDVQALVDDPIYLGINLTAISFVLAGFREELWRSGVLAGFTALFPGLTSTWRGKGLAIAFTALLFGLGHLPQGIGAVVLTMILGIGLGWIMLWRRSIWEAVFAHGFFDATTFFMLYLLQRNFPDMLSG